MPARKNKVIRITHYYKNGEWKSTEDSTIYYNENIDILQEIDIEDNVPIYWMITFQNTKHLVKGINELNN